MDENMSIDKKDDVREPSEDSMSSTPEPEAGPSHPENQGQPKRKGGRKPVRCTCGAPEQKHVSLIKVDLCHIGRA
jgi:hypothetical protein